MWNDGSDGGMMTGDGADGRIRRDLLARDPGHHHSRRGVVRPVADEQPSAIGRASLSWP